MNILKKIYDSVAMTAGVVTEGNWTYVDLQSYSKTKREFALSAKIVENTTAPGGARTITVNYYWSDYLYNITETTEAELILRLAARKTAATAMTRRNTASSTTCYSTVATPFRPIARYLYVSITKTTEDALSIPTLTLNLVGVPGQVTSLDS